MKIIDRHIVGHFVRPFLVGVAAFAGIIIGIEQLHTAAQLVVQDGFPVGLVVEALLLRTPMTIALTMPMAALFAALMVAGELSGHGELVAMRAGGASSWRTGLPVVLGGLGVCFVSFALNEAIGPVCGNKGTNMLRDYLRENRELEKWIFFRMPEEGEAQRLVYADSLSVRNRRMTNVTITEFERGQPRDVFFAERAEYSDGAWRLVGVEKKEYTGRGYREVLLPEISYPLGRSIEDIRFKTQKRPEDLTMRELRQEIARTAPERDIPASGTNRNLILRQHMHIRIAAPWAAFCFAILGFPLGMRPQRTSTGTGFGISLAIVFVYYIVFHVLQALGESGTLSPVMAAWVPNSIVLGVGLGMFIDSSR